MHNFIEGHLKELHERNLDISCLKLVPSETKYFQDLLSPLLTKLEKSRNPLKTFYMTANISSCAAILDKCDG